MNDYKGSSESVAASRAIPYVPAGHYGAMKVHSRPPVMYSAKAKEFSRLSAWHVRKVSVVTAIGSIGDLDLSRLSAVSMASSIDLSDDLSEP